MIDIKFLRENPDVKQECNSKADWCSYGSGKEGRG